MDNDLLLKFAQAAGISASSETDIHPSVRKFADLIIEECGVIADECAEKETTVTPSAHMKVHFDVLYQGVQ
jgi:hypothetical protein